MDVDLRDLELLDALGHHVTLTAAAQHLFVSQPALSQRLIRLEERLGTPLFERRGRRLVATQAGRRMLRAARVALHEVRSAEDDVRRIGLGRRQPLRLSSQCATNYQWLSPILRTFREVMPGSEVEIENLPADKIIAALREEQLDLALICKVEPDMNHVRLQRLFDDELVAVVSGTHPWAGRRSVAADDFGDVHLILHDAYDPGRVPSLPLPLPPRARPARLSTLPITTDLLIEMVGSGHGVTVLPSWTVEPYLGDGRIGVVHVEDPGQRRSWYCATRHGTRPDHLDRFVEVLLDHFSTDAAAP